MTVDRMIELLNSEHDCMLRNSHDDCNRDCANCDLVQDDGELHDMYTSVISLLKAQEPIAPIENAGFYYCGACKYAFTVHRQKYCSECGRAVKWDA